MNCSLVGTSFGTLIAYPIAGILCNSGILGGWPSVFYIFGKLISAQSGT